MGEIKHAVSGVREIAPPTLRAFEYHRPDGGSVMLVWCKWCSVLHKHGVGGGNHRTAHCFSEAHI